MTSSANCAGTASERISKCTGRRTEGLPQLLELLAKTATRTGSPKYYDPKRMTSFLRELDGPVRVLEVRENGGESLAAAVCFIEERRVQAWAAGYVRDRADLPFSPYYALWWEMVSLMWSTGAESSRLDGSTKPSRKKCSSLRRALWQ